MKPLFIAAGAAALVLSGLAAARPTSAAPLNVRHAAVRHVDDHFSLSLVFGGGREYCPPPAYYAPPPPYYYAPPVGYYYAPAPVYPSYGVRFSFGGNRYYDRGDHRRWDRDDRRGHDDFHGRRW